MAVEIKENGNNCIIYLIASAPCIIGSEFSNLLRCDVKLVITIFVEISKSAVECGFGRNCSSTFDGVCQEFAIGFETP